MPAAEWHWPHFSAEEIACRGDGSLLVDYHAMDCLEAFRIALGKPIILNSAYRSADWNKHVGGAPGSQHLLGRAFDCRMDNHVPADFEKLASTKGFNGFGHYIRQNFMHIDVGPKRRWNQNGWFPSKSASQQEPVPGFTNEKPAATVVNSLMKPEVLVPVGTAIGASGISGVAAGNGPVAWAIGAVLVLVAVVAAGVWLRKQMHPKLND